MWYIPLLCLTCIESLGSQALVFPPQITCTHPTNSPSALIIGETVNCRFSSPPTICTFASPLTPHVCCAAGSSNRPVSSKFTTNSSASLYVTTSQKKRHKKVLVMSGRFGGSLRASLVPFLHESPSRRTTKQRNQYTLGTQEQSKLAKTPSAMHLTTPRVIGTPAST